ncbi:MAG: nuclease [Rhodocyclales bacterium]|nr:nuclease [Rhodocyclales bacterium]
MRWMTALLFALALLPGTASAWGRQGHAAVAALAQSNLSPTALAQMRTLLADDLDRNGKPSHRTTLASVASWADEIRDIAPKDAYRGWHVRANPVCSDKLGACRDGNCVDQLIIKYAAILKDHSQSLQSRNEALKWVVHLVGDMHQPLHSGVNVDGGNIAVALAPGTTVIQLKPGTTLHALWDTDIAVLTLKEGPLRGTLADNAPLAADAPTAWMLESRDVARKSAYDALTGFTCNEHLGAPVMIDTAYLQQASQTARVQMEKAGLRLAHLLNDAMQ